MLYLIKPIKKENRKCSKTLSLKYKKSFKALTNNENVKLETEIGEVELPAKKGTKIGKLHIYCNNEKSH